MSAKQRELATSIKCAQGKSIGIYKLNDNIIKNGTPIVKKSKFKAVVISTEINSKKHVKGLVNMFQRRELEAFYFGYYTTITNDSVKQKFFEFTTAVLMKSKLKEIEVWCSKNPKFTFQVCKHIASLQKVVEIRFLVCFIDWEKKTGKCLKAILNSPSKCKFRIEKENRISQILLAFDGLSNFENIELLEISPNHDDFLAKPLEKFIKKGLKIRFYVQSVKLTNIAQALNCYAIFEKYQEPQLRLASSHAYEYDYPVLSKVLSQHRVEKIDIQVVYQGVTHNVKVRRFSTALDAMGVFKRTLRPLMSIRSHNYGIAGQIVLSYDLIGKIVQPNDRWIIR